MPKIFEYLGIVILFYSNEHDPVHVHARYQDAVVKVSFFIKNGEVYRTTYKQEEGKFPAAKLKELKNFVLVYKEEIVNRWDRYFIWKEKVKFERIDKRLK